jgi:hypothetical protein
MMNRSLLDQALSCGCVCKCDSSGNWKIFPSQKNARWELKQVKDRWFLVAGDIAQANLDARQAEGFLKRRCSNRSKQEAVFIRIVGTSRSSALSSI